MDGSSDENAGLAGDPKAMARALRAVMTGRGIQMSHAEALEIVARQFGCENWNVLAARLAGDARAPGGTPAGEPAFRQTIPILRIFSVEKAREFYEGFLGFTVAWEHRYEPDMPLYAEVSRAGMVLHLSEHHGDASPGSTVFVWMTGIEAFHRELLAKRYGYSRPGLERTGYDALMFEVPDPFGNRIRFNESLKR